LSRKVRLALLFFGREGTPLMAWPLHNYDVGRKISELINECSTWCVDECEFIIKKWIKSREDLEEVLSRSSEIDGVVVYILTTSINYGLFYEVVKVLGKPTLVLTEPYHSLAWPEIAELMREGYPVIGVSSSSREDRVKGVRVLYTYVMLKRKVRVLVITVPEETSLESLHKHEIYSGDRVYSENYYTRLREFTDLIFVDYTELMNTYLSVSEEDAGKIVDKILKNSYWVREGVKPEDLIKATKIYVALKKLLNKYGADALAVNCFTIMLKDLNALPTTPCVAVSLLNDEGIPAACEADLSSLLLQVIFKYLARKPAWISDPVIDFSDGSVTYAHCTAPTKMKGFTEEAEPYAIDTHDESGRPAVIRTKMSLGQAITITQISPDFSKLYLHVNKIADTPIIDLACRTKVKTFVRNVREWLWAYKQPLHRVIVYGDWSYELSMLSKLMKMEILYEPD